MFSQNEFIDASRDFVCVRLESYESKEHQDMVRSFLEGRFENTAFCLLSPDGKERLSRSARGPSQVLAARGFRRNKEESLGDVVKGMKAVAEDYRTKDKKGHPVVQDFHTFRQALNVASGDQRLLLFVNAPEGKQDKLRETLRPVMGDDVIIGRFHADFAGGENDAKWHESVEGASSKPGFYIIRSGEFGLEGEVMTRLPLDAGTEDIKEALLEANRKFARDEERKVYSEHVREGRREGVHFENAMPYGEDRDADGEIDQRRGRRPGGPGGEEGRRGPPPRGERGRPGDRRGPPPGGRRGPPRGGPGGPPPGGPPR